MNKYSGLPGKGAAGIPDATAFRQGTLSYRRKTIDKILHEVFSFPDWDKVLAHFGLKPAILPPTLTPMKMSTSFGAAAKETKEHKRLKEFIARNPHELGLKGFPNGVVEYAFPSADEIDVLFKTNTRWVGVEVKGCKSGDMDIRRGLYQCVKYLALMDACQKAELKKIPTTVILVLGGVLPRCLIAEKHTLGIDCRESVTVPAHFKL